VAEPPKLLFVASDYLPSPGGIARYLDTLVRGMREVGADARILVAVPSAKHETIAFLQNYEDWAEALVVREEERPSARLANMAVSAVELSTCVSGLARRVSRNWGPLDWAFSRSEAFSHYLDSFLPGLVVFGHLNRRCYPFVLTLRERGIPYVVIAHDYEVYPPPLHHFNDWFVKGVVMRNAGRVFPNSNHTGSIVAKWGIPLKRITVIPPPVSSEVFDAALLPVEKNTGVKERFTIASVCRLVHSKGIDLVLQALSTLREKGANFHYVIAGDGPERSSLEEMCRRLGLMERVLFLGHVSEEQKFGLYRQADVFVLPSRVVSTSSHEGFGIVFLEAAAFGVPSVATIAGGIPDAVINGETGLLVTPESPEEIAAALLRLMQDPDLRERLGSKGRERALTEFRPKHVAARFLAALSLTREPTGR
jgi:glycosyltransferase involved in cell wall biosynthesis